MTTVPAWTVEDACPHLREILSSELALGNLVDWVDMGGGYTVIKLKQPWRAGAMATTGLSERVVINPSWAGQELYCIEHRQRLVTPT